MEELEFEETKLTPRQWALFRLLESQPDHWFTQKEICDAIPLYSYKDEITVHDHCPAIGKDKIEINANPRVDKIITMQDCCFKIATLEEYKKERATHIARLKSQKAQIEAMDYKFERHGQGKIFNNILEELKESNEQFHETFYEETKPTEPEFPNEINGVKVYNRVVIDWANKKLYFVTCKKLSINYDYRSCGYKADIELANGEIKTIFKVMPDSISIETYKSKNQFEDFRKEYLR